MALSWDEIKENALAFSKKWKKIDRNEEAAAQSFERDFLAVFGIEDPMKEGFFEYKVALDGGHNGYIDYFLPGKLAVEQHARAKDLHQDYQQFNQYAFHLPAEEMPELILCCDFETFVLYHRNTGERRQWKLGDLHKNIKQFANIAGYETTREYDDQVEVNIKAAEKMAKLHDALKTHGYSCVIFSVLSALAVIRVIQSFFRITMTLPSLLWSQTRLSLRFLTCSMQFSFLRKL